MRVPDGPGEAPAEPPGGRKIMIFNCCFFIQELFVSKGTNTTQLLNVARACRLLMFINAGICRV